MRPIGELTESDFQRLIAPLLGKMPWNVCLGMGSSLTMEFGREDPRQSTVNVHGEWHLWLYMCSWRIESADGILVACEDGREEIRKRFRKISWAEISNVALGQPSMDLEISFQDRRRLRTFSVNASDAQEIDQWILFTPELMSISAIGNKLVTKPSISS